MIIADTQPLADTGLELLDAGDTLHRAVGMLASGQTGPLDMAFALGACNRWKSAHDRFLTVLDHTLGDA
jgi:hypothetical protein